MPVEIVNELPTMGQVYAKSVKTLARKGKNPVLPDRTLVYQGATADAQKLAEYRRAVGARMTGELPSLYVHTLAFPLAMSLMVREDFPLPLLGMIHLTNKVTVQRPLGEAEAFDVQVNAENLGSHAKGVSCDLVVRISTQGEERMVLRSTFLAKGATLSGSTPEKAGRREFSVPLQTAQWKLGADTGRGWAAVAGDYNPIHLGRLSAKVLGMPRAIAHGIYLAARTLADIEPVGVGYEWEIEFMTPVQLPGTVHLAFDAEEDGFEVTAWNPRKLKPHFELELELLD
ncbi:MaoC/PaaZ C-terminal domain-containing protein [Glutamicibacter sp. MNS18]|uniref:MaoC/PaaZ C-terminal domain-containing protein n=1 Tax=Glutamicibacter sp. MNS18 TaxID=2989817 RepID=UPI0022369F16|nr:MaoC/PaaZ C-terminal domain-containing protein [Glutamicibacter sp. MNS18]MCW4464923.1 MaoC/PaaZ C-terminal domain-containing protein [Glutamicibacter sp. MNS18]